MVQQSLMRITACLGALLGFSLTLVTTHFSAFEVVALFLFLATFPFLWSLIRVQEQRFRLISLSLFGMGSVLMLSFLFLPGDQAFFTLVTFYCLMLTFLGYCVAQMGLRQLFVFGYRVGAILVAILGLITWYGLEGTWLHTTFIQGDRLMMLFSDPNVFGAFLVPAIVFELMTLIKRYHDGQSVWFSVLLLPLLTVTLYFSGSRGAFVNGAIALSAFLFLAWRYGYVSLRKALIPLILFPLCVGGIFLVSEKGELFENRYNASIAPRLSTYAWAWEEVVERDVREMVRGSGGGSFELYSPRGVSAHNTYIRLLYEQGILGLCTFLTLIAVVFIQCLKEGRPALLRLAFAAAIIGLLAQSFVIDTLHMRHFWLFLGLV